MVIINETAKYACYKRKESIIFSAFTKLLKGLYLLFCYTGELKV